MLAYRSTAQVPVSIDHHAKANNNLLKDSGKDSIFVHLQVNTFYLTEDVQVLPNLTNKVAIEKPPM